VILPKVESGIEALQQNLCCSASRKTLVIYIILRRWKVSSFVFGELPLIEHGSPHGILNGDLNKAGLMDSKQKGSGFGQGLYLNIPTLGDTYDYFTQVTCDIT
jgi:hypothetical protein